MMLPLVVGCTSAVCVIAGSRSIASGVDNAASPTGRHRWTGLFHLREEADHYKNNEEPRSILMSSADRRHTMATHAIIVSNTHASSGDKCLSNKTE